MANLSFFPNSKGFFPNYICSALNIDPENNILMSDQVKGSLYDC